MRDVSLRVKLPFRIHAAFNLTFTQGFDDGGGAGKKIVRLLHLFRAGVERPSDAGAQPIEQSLPGARRDFVAHQDANLVELMPFAIEREQRPDFEVASGDVEGAGEVSPFLNGRAVPSISRHCHRRRAHHGCGISALSKLNRIFPLRPLCCAWASASWKASMG